MKRVKYIVLFILTMNAGLKAQWIDPCGDQSAWDWTDNLTGSNWNAYLTTGVISMGSPFNSPASGDIHFIEITEDYLPEDGWFLLLKNFGCSGHPVSGAQPYFVLYNRYRAVLRVFQFNNNGGDYDGALFKSTWIGSNQTSLLTFANPNAEPDNFYTVPSASSDIVLNYVADYYANGAWYVTDFSVAFDHNTNPATFYDLQFRTYNVLTQNITLAGGFNFTTKSGTMSGKSENKEPADDGPGVLKWLQAGNEFLGKLPTLDDLSAQLNDASEDITNCADWVCENLSGTDVGLNFGYDLESLGNDINTAGTIGSFLGTVVTAAASVNGVFGTAIEVLKFFTGQVKATSGGTTNSEPFQPTISSGTLDLAGEIRTESNGTSFHMQLPGGNHPSHISNPPYYDCPLGVISLENQPSMAIKQVTVQDQKILTHTWDTPWTTHGVCPEDSKYVYWETKLQDRRYKSLRIESPLNIAINDASGMELVELKASLVCSILENGDKPAYDISGYPIIKYDEQYLTGEGAFTYISSAIPEGSIPSHLASICDGSNPYAVSTNITNQTEKSAISSFIKDRTYILNEVDGVKGLHVYSTPLIDANRFLNTSVFVPLETKVTLKISALMRNKYQPEKAPVLIVQSYNLDESLMTNLEPNGSPFEFTEVQLKERLLNPDGNINILDDLVIDPVISGSSSLTFSNGHWGAIDVNVNNDVNMNIEYNTSVNSYFQDGTITAWNSIEINPGFDSYADPSLHFFAVIAKGYNHEPVIEGGNALQENHYFADCFVKSMHVNIDNEIEKEANSFMNSDEIKLSVAPNPTNSNTKINILDFDHQSIYTLRLLGMDGKLIKTMILSSGEAELDLNNLESGLYLVDITNGINHAFAKVYKIE